MGGGYGQGRNGPSRFFCPRWIQGQSGQFMWGKGFGPGGPPVHQRYSKDKVDKPLRYLLRKSYIHWNHIVINPISAETAHQHLIYLLF